MKTLVAGSALKSKYIVICSRAYGIFHFILLVLLFPITKNDPLIRSVVAVTLRQSCSACIK